MKKATGLGLFVALALVGTACGKSSSELNKPETLPQQEVQAAVVDDNKQEAEPKSQEPQSKPADKNASTGNASDPSTSNKSSAATAASGGSSSSTGGGGNAPSSGSTPASAGNSTTPGSANQGDTSGPSTQAGSATPAGQFELSVTEYFGSNGIFKQGVSYSAEQSLLDTMRDHLEIETAYGGGYVNSINGTKSGYTDKSFFTRKKRDWFYYVNGSIGKVGADAIKPKSGDAVWWDYHDWSGDGSSTPHVVASYPHPFTTGYDGAQPGTTIFYSGDHASDAARLATALRGLGAGNVSTTAYADDKVAHPSTNAIVLGTWGELGEQAAVQTLFGAPTRTGLYAKFGGDHVQALTYQGKSTDRNGQSAILASGSNGGGGTTPTWLVIGATEAGLDQAIDIMITSPDKLHGKIGVVINGTDALAVPVAQ
ncbi:DUF4430 domain-containing protein [Tumebacillus permanentifrigoris]|uniref:Uncharacterized protein DUF4430 n=1 Tax=Tumebacillus permanentifrigoris TaxID=378543 RepID=A0A316D9Z3_9BACL|nr:DUF4430 domain-containing protein [Tumebacillus permanentifrigoris]PWK13779.1 uncharacterized protein DUF4430 [Tumebacillus permanentifrigoris]